MNPKVSILVPVFNASKTIFRCLESIQIQTFEDFEVLIVNDGSTDDSLSIIESFIVNKPCFKIFNKQNEGVAKARNFALQKALSIYVCFVDSDDYLEANYISTLVNNLKSTNSQLACCGYYDHSKYGNFKLNNYSKLETDSTDSQTFSTVIFDQIGGVLWDKMFILELIKSNSITMDLDVYYYEDSLFVLDYLKYCSKISLVSQPLYHYDRTNEDSFTSKINFEWKTNIILYNKSIIQKLKHFNCPQNTVDKIVSKSLFGFYQAVFSYKNLTNHTIVHSYTKANDILDSVFFESFLPFDTKFAIEKPFVFFINKKWVFCIIIWSYCLEFCKIINRFFRLNATKD